MSPKSLFLSLAIVSCLVAIGSTQTMISRLHYFSDASCSGVEQAIIPMYEGNNTLCAVQSAPNCEGTLYGMTHQEAANASCGQTGAYYYNATTMEEHKSLGGIRYINYGACVASTRFPGCYLFYQVPSYQFSAPTVAAPTSAASPSLASAALALSLLCLLFGAL